VNRYFELWDISLGGIREVKTDVLSTVDTRSESLVHKASMSCIDEGRFITLFMNV
jgi:hypothetical protein